MMQPRHKKFLEELPKNGNKVKPAAIKAGYSPMYAHANGRKILKTAIKAQAQEIIDTIDATPTNTTKRLMYEQIGITEQSLYDNLKYLLSQEKDLSTRLKVLIPLIAETGVQLQTEEAPKTIVPVLNIGVRTAQQSDIPLIVENGDANS